MVKNTDPTSFNYEKLEHILKHSKWAFSGWLCNNFYAVKLKRGFLKRPIKLQITSFFIYASYDSPFDIFPKQCILTSAAPQEHSVFKFDEIKQKKIMDYLIHCYKNKDYNKCFNESIINALEKI